MEAVFSLGRDTGWAMTQEKVESLRKVYAEWGKGNFRPVTDVYNADLEWGWSEEFPGLEGVVREPAAKSERLVRWLSSWEEWRVEPEDFIVGGNHVVVLCRYTGRGKGSGVDVDTHGAHLWTFREGKAIRLQVFSSRERALEAAGLSE
jgi:ketosteroid isomerase-like protein